MAEQIRKIWEFSQNYMYRIVTWHWLSKIVFSSPIEFFYKKVQAAYSRSMARASTEEVQEYWRDRTKAFGDSWASSFWNDEDISKKVDDLQMQSLRPYILQIKPDHKVLDVGCGVGRFSVRFAERGAEVHGIDTAEDAIMILQKKAISNAKFEVMDVRELKYNDCTFDWIFSITVLQHIIEVRELYRAIKEVMRVLKTNGRILMLECATNMRADRYVISLARSEWVKLIEAAGGRIESIEGLAYPQIGWEDFYVLICVVKI